MTRYVSEQRDGMQTIEFSAQSPASRKHTDGPWIAELGEAYRVRAQQDGGQVAIMTNLKGQFGMSGRRSGDEVAANARLIAAAPDLLEALQLTLNAVCLAGWDGDYSAQKAREAIAKATGG